MNQQLTWVEISQNQYRSQRFAHHRLGMREPMATRGLHASKLDLLVMPLLACDQYGTRIGMGAVIMIVRWQQHRTVLFVWG